MLESLGPGEIEGELVAEGGGLCAGNPRFFQGTGAVAGVGRCAGYMPTMRNRIAVWVQGHSLSATIPPPEERRKYGRNYPIATMKTMSEAQAPTARAPPPLATSHSNPGSQPTSTEPTRTDQASRYPWLHDPRRRNRKAGRLCDFHERVTPLCPQ